MTTSSPWPRPERLGFDAFFRSDHYLVMGGSDGLPGPTDAWVTLAGLARETSRLRLGTLVTSAVPPARTAGHQRRRDRPDERGRVELGLGGLVRGRAPGLRRAVPPARRALRAVGGAASRSSPGCGPRRSVSASRSPAVTTRSRTRPAAQADQQPRPPVIVGGHGRPARPARGDLRRRVQPRVPRWRSSPSSAPGSAACEAIGRDPPRSPTPPRS